MSELCRVIREGHEVVQVSLDPRQPKSEASDSVKQGEHSRGSGFLEDSRQGQFEFMGDLSAVSFYDMEP